MHHAIFRDRFGVTFKLSGLNFFEANYKLWDYYIDPSNTPVTTYKPGTPDNVPTTCMWNDPSDSSGLVYDWDDVGTFQFQGSTPTGAVYRLRLNFTEFAVVGDTTSEATVGNALQLFGRDSCAKLATGSTLDTTFTGDNKAGPGTTPTTRTLQ